MIYHLFRIVIIAGFMGLSTALVMAFGVESLTIHTVVGFAWGTIYAYWDAAVELDKRL